MVSAPERKNGLWIPGYDEGAPRLDEVMSLYSDYLTYYQAFHKQCAGDENYYHRKFAVDAPKGFTPVIPATGKAIVDVATDHVDVNNIAIDVPLASPRAAARAERIQKFLIGAWAQTKEPVLRTSVRHAFMYGIAWRKRMFAPELWPDAPKYDDYTGDGDYKEALADFMEKRSLSYPLVSKNVNPKNLLWDDSRAGRKWVIEFYQQDSRDIRYRYPEWLPKSQNRMATWMEYWDDTWCMYIADGDVVWGPYRHGYGFVPYISLIPNSSLDFDDGPPETRYQGILHAITSLIEAEARLVTQYEAIIRQVAWRTLDFYGPQQIAERTASEYVMFGGTNVIPPGVEVKPSPSLQAPQELLSHLGTVQSLMEQATFPNVVRGLRPTGVSTGFGLSVLAGMGRLVFQGIADGLARSIETENKCILQLVENKVRGRLTVHARSDVHSFDQSIGPDDINGYYESSVRIKAEAPEEREREALLALRLWNGGQGIIDLYEAQRRSGVTNPLEMQNRQAAERIMADPQVAMAMAQQAMQMLGLPQQMGEAASLTGEAPDQVGNMNIGGAQLQRPGERNVQQARVASNMGNPSVFPQGMSGMDMLGNQLAMPGGGATDMPNGRTVP